MSGNKILISVVIMTKNEERNIAKCLQSARNFSEIFVVDSQSTDRTRTISAEKGAIVVPFVWNGQYPKKKQWCLDHLNFSHNWVLYLDADEELTAELVDEIRASIESGQNVAGYYVAYDYVFLGKMLRYGYRAKKLVLLNRLKSEFRPMNDLDATHMWEVEGHYQPNVDGKVQTLRNRMRHDDQDDLYHYFERHNRYTDWEAAIAVSQSLSRHEESMPPLRRLQKLASRVVPFRPALVFLHSYVLRLGLLDGYAGFHYAAARAFYYWQINIKIHERKQRSQH